MSEHLPEVEDWIDEKIEYDKNRDYQDHFIIEVFEEAEEPFLSRAQVQERLENNPSDESLRIRLNQLIEIGVLQDHAVMGGRVFWIKDDRSRWPIPDDVTVEGKPDEPTISEFTDRLDVKLGAAAALSAFLSSILISSFIATIAYRGVVTGWIPEAAFILGIITALLSLGFGVTTCVAYIIEKRSST